VAPEATNINCIKSLQVHGLGKSCSVIASSLYGMNCLSTDFSTITRFKGSILNADFSEYLVCFQLCILCVCDFYCTSLGAAVSALFAVQSHVSVFK